MKECRECHGQVSEHALMCPHCGAPRPAPEKWDGWGFEYKSRARWLGMPLVHVSFKFAPNFVPVPARGVLAIGQFGAGIVTISQFGVGVVNLSQFGIGGLVVAQFALGVSIVAQIGLYLEKGYGHVVKPLASLFGA